MSITATKFTEHQIILWHNSRRLPIPGVVVTAKDATQTATIKIRNLEGQTQQIQVAYSEIEARA